MLILDNFVGCWGANWLTRSFLSDKFRGNPANFSESTRILGGDDDISEADLQSMVYSVSATDDTYFNGGWVFVIESTINERVNVAMEININE